MDCIDKKKCFVIMPISDADNYPKGHFNLVYDYLIKPAILKAGLIPIRADEVKKTNYIIIDILKEIINCEIAICDLSSQNPNVLYELGIRHSFNLPVTLIKDTKTKNIFDIQGIRYIEYDENLRIDNVEDSIDEIVEVLKNTTEIKSDEVNSIIQLLKISPAEIKEQTPLSIENTIILDAINSINEKLTHLENNNSSITLSNYSNIDNADLFYITTLLDYLPEIDGKIELGDIVFHKKFGVGIIAGASKLGNDRKLKINFSNSGIKTLMENYAKLKLIKKKNSKFEEKGCDKKNES